MIVKDFEYDNEFLSDWGYEICEFDTSNGFETIDTDSQLTFDSVSQNNGKYFPLTISYYSDHIEIPFQICKIRGPSVITPLTVFEIRELKRWLNRPAFHKFKLIQKDWADIYMDGSFNISEIKFNNVTYGLELTFISNRPFALHEPITYKFDIGNDSDTFTFFDKSDEIVYIYPSINITCLSSGNLELINSQEPDRKTIINNVSENETISCTPSLIISTSLSSHQIQNDFNFKFLRVSNQYGNRKNVLSSSIPVQIQLTYTPYIKAVW